MHPALTIIDDLLPHHRALEIREEVLSRGFEDFEFMQGTYQGTQKDFCPPDMHEAISRFLRAPIVPEISAFRSGHTETSLHVNIHADNVVKEWAAVYYLSLPEDCMGGTAFWTLKDTGWDTMPTQAQLDGEGKTLDWLRTKWTEEDQWILNTVAGMKFNRLIFYPSRYFHSRFPLEGFGSKNDLAHARLVWVTFFDIRSPAI